MTHWIALFDQLPWLFLLLTTALGLILGSFLNVVIHRMPLMMEREWQQECAEALSIPAPASELPDRFNLMVPGSACPRCGTAIPIWHNIPVLSYLLLRGRCHHCKTPISLRYPTVELLTGLATLFLAWHFGPSAQFLAAWVLTLGLISLAAIDFDTMLLPDQLTLPLLWLGLLVNLNGLFVPLEQAVIGAALGYLSLWSLFQLFKLLTGKEGMGYGDFKLLALFGAWFGYPALLPVILIASIGGAVVGIALQVSGKLGRGKPMPFGPWIVLGGWIYLVWGTDIVNWYLHTVVGV
ncbi:A24 family peptidase [Ferrimonas balearica]|uniref:prepilin peptidase n=1 Tax=Ferrimonas balearica TaxID=44012 RepID=UPI001C59111C|nr:A24 family peptidase [Ferrimonas balearica]MBW3140388.1 A24 family peptidase [Ferrimonas balearica]